MRRNCRGTALIEFALVLPLLVILVFGTIDGARIFATWNRVKNAAHEGAAFAQFFPTQQSAVGTACAAPNNITDRAKAEGTDLTITVSPAVTPACQTMGPSAPVQPGGMVTVTATVPFSFITPLAGVLWGKPTVRASVKMTVQG
ncbi:MAG TPA: TadE/TadG family type IV pilus assembly protein [Acidimicrobiales bacterium]|nr:TadE/TadG family type IV pilus assembly protein [Acidimicrobiales bacterium]